MAQLSTFAFTTALKVADSADSVTNGQNGWQNHSAGITTFATVSAKAGDDTIQSIGYRAVLGNLAGTPVNPVAPTSAYYQAVPTVLYSAAIANGRNGTIDMGVGADTLKGSIAGANTIGVLNGKIGGSTLKTFVPVATGGTTTSQILMGEGDDSIIGENTSAADANSYGIYNSGYIDLGNGKDSIIGVKSSTSTTGAAIYNSGLMVGGLGDDTFDAFQGGWAGNGTVNCGFGNDTVTGFGSGNFDGGAGVNDALVLGAGSYTVKYTVRPTATAATFNLTRLGDANVMKLTGFEAITSFNPLAEGVHPQALAGQRLSAFTINDAGVFTAVSLVANTPAL
jgi:hypothetical protein